MVLRLDSGRNRMLAKLLIDRDAQLWTFEAQRRYTRHDLRDSNGPLQDSLMMMSGRV
jgi:hypothetical protein